MYFRFKIISHLYRTYIFNRDRDRINCLCSNIRNMMVGEMISMNQFICRCDDAVFKYLKVRIHFQHSLLL